MSLYNNTVETESRPRVKVVETKRPHWEELSVVIFWGLTLQSKFQKCFLQATVIRHIDFGFPNCCFKMAVKDGCFS